MHKADSMLLPWRRYASPMFLGVDTGGTFTDFVHFDGRQARFHKVLSTPHDPSRAILQGIEELGLHAEQLHLVHGSTVATNAILERKGVKTLFVTNSGIEDLLTIARQTRASLYDLCPEQPERWVEQGDCFGVTGRIDGEGRVLAEISNEDLEALKLKAAAYDAVAICTLFSFLNPEQENSIAAVIPAAVFCSVSHDILAEYREYERASTTFLNAYVGPLVQRYLQRLAGELAPKQLFIMHSAGGLMNAEEAGRQSARMVLSGPAGGLVAVQSVSRQTGIKSLMSFDMGGTSTDVALIDGQVQITTEGSIAGMPVAVPMLDIHTIGAGGGSIAWSDAAGLLQVGPESAGASPGPVAYGQGGTKPTVTDANVLLGRIPANARLAGSLTLDMAGNRAAMTEMAAAFGMDAETLAQGIIEIAEENMVGALRVVSVQRGFDPRQFSLICFGGAGGLHACALAEKLDIPQVVLPVASGAFSAFGMLSGRRQCDLSQTRRLALESSESAAALQQIIGRLKEDAQQRLAGLNPEYEITLDLRYCGQGFHLTLPFSEPSAEQPEQSFDSNMKELQLAFADAHELAYGHSLNAEVEIITVRLTAFADSESLELPELAEAEKPVQAYDQSEIYQLGTALHYHRDQLRPGHRLTGPALVIEDTATLLILPQWQLSVSSHGHLLLDRVGV